MKVLKKWCSFAMSIGFLLCILAGCGDGFKVDGQKMERFATGGLIGAWVCPELGVAFHIKRTNYEPECYIYIAGEAQGPMRVSGVGSRDADNTIEYVRLGSYEVYHSDDSGFLIRHQTNSNEREFRSLRCLYTNAEMMNPQQLKTDIIEVLAKSCASVYDEYGGGQGLTDLGLSIGSSLTIGEAYNGNLSAQFTLDGDAHNAIISFTSGGLEIIRLSSRYHGDLIYLRY